MNKEQELVKAWEKADRKFHETRLKWREARRKWDEADEKDTEAYLKRDKARCKLREYRKLIKKRK